VNHFEDDAAGNPTLAECIGNHPGCILTNPAGALSGARGVAITPDARHLYVVSYGGNNVSHFTLDASGKPTFVGCNGDLGGCTPTSGATTTLRRAEEVIVTPDAKNLYVVSGGDNQASTNINTLTHFTLDGSGVPTFADCVGNQSGCASPSVADALCGAHDLTLGRDGQNLYVAASNTPFCPNGGSNVSRFTIAPSGQPTFANCVGDLTGCTAVNPAGAMFVTYSVAGSPDGQRLYAGANTTVSNFVLGAGGAHSFLGCIGSSPSGCTATPFSFVLFGMEGLAVTPNGRRLYGASYGNDNVSQFTIDDSGVTVFAGCIGASSISGCTATTPVNALNGPIDLAVSPDGKQLYTADYDGGNIVHFTIEQPPSPGPGGASPRDVVPASMSDYRLSHSSFAAAARGDSIAGSAKRRRAKIGTIVRYKLSEQATVTFKIQKRSTGRRVRGRCVKRSRRNRHKRRCTRYLALRGSFSHKSTQGSNAFKFTGRLQGRRLAPGRYKLVATASDDAGNVSPSRRVAFRIVRR
jgi:DNA-binding beta-propeller fold protein YncE